MQPHKAGCVKHSGRHLVPSLEVRSIVKAARLDERFRLLDGRERGIEASHVAIAHARYGVAVHDQRAWACVRLHCRDHALHLSHELSLVIDKVSALAEDNHR